MADSTQGSLQNMASSLTLSSKSRCKICNNLDYRGHQDTDLQGNHLVLELAFQKLNCDCPFCRLIISSIESVVDKDSWNARQISPDDGSRKNGSVTLVVAEDEPIIVFVHYDDTNHTEAEVNNTWGFSERAHVKFMIYSSDEVCFSPKASENLMLKMK